MTCSSCVEKITEKINKISDVKSVNVRLEDGLTEIDSIRTINLIEVKNALNDMPKYRVINADEFLSSNINQSNLKTYKPLIIVFGYIILVSLSYQLFQKKFQLHLFMNHIMAGFFIGLSFFKFLDLKSFAESFSGYDPIAKKISAYGKVYPFIELALGLMFIAGIWLRIANLITVVILSMTTIGVIQRLNSKSKIQCACLGSGFNLPLSCVTVAENMAMLLMALYGMKLSF